MRNAFRNAGIVGALVASLGGGPTPAHAAGAVTFSATIHINCFGCGVTTGTAELCVNGTVDARPIVCVPGTANDPNVIAAFTANEPTGPTCLISGSASGNTAGDVEVDFNWTRVGAHAVLSTRGDINGAGTATFVVTSPIGLVCGGPVIARSDGSVTGT